MIECKSRPVIFPKLARELIISDGRLALTGRKRADFKLLELLISSTDLPHIMIWNTTKKVWEPHQDHTKVKIMDDVIIEYDYHRIRKFDDALLMSWLNLYSSASFSLLQSRDVDGLAEEIIRCTST